MSANRSETLTHTAGAEEKGEEGREQSGRGGGSETRGELSALLRGESWRPQAAAAAVVLGRITTVDEGGSVSVQLEGSPHSRPARLGVVLSVAQLLAAARADRAAILAFENGDPALPIVMGLMPPAGPQGATDRKAQAEGAPAEAGPSQSAPATRAAEVYAEVDGRRVRIVAEDEIVLECGSASITLRRNGRVVIHGDYIETHSEGTNRIKGGQVRIN
jgi:Domain of unknown function (DUF6484)